MSIDYSQNGIREQLPNLPVNTSRTSIRRSTLRMLTIALSFVLLAGAPVQSVNAEMSIKERLAYADRFNKIRAELTDEIGRETASAAADIEAARNAIDQQNRRNAEQADKADAEYVTKIILPMMELGASLGLALGKIYARLPPGKELGNALSSTVEIRLAYEARKQVDVQLAAALGLANDRLNAANSKGENLLRLGRDMDRIVQEARDAGLFGPDRDPGARPASAKQSEPNPATGASQGSASGPMVSQEQLKDVLERARNEAGVDKATAETMIGRCIAESRTRFPKSTNAYVAGTCSCIGGKLRAMIGVGAPGSAPFDRSFKAEMTNCGTSTLAALSARPDVLGPMRNEVIASCRSKPADFFASGSEEAEKSCSCIFDRMLKENRPQMVMWKHLGADSAIEAPMQAAVAACNPNKPVVLKSFPFTGDFFPVRRRCNGNDVGEEERILRITPRGISGYESVCDSSKITQQGNIFTSVNKCSEYETTWTYKSKIELVDADTIKVYGTNNSSPSTLYRCK